MIVTIISVLFDDFPTVKMSVADSRALTESVFVKAPLARSFKFVKLKLE